MAKTAIYCDRVFRPSVPLAHAVRSGDLIFVSGIPPFQADGSVAPGDFPAQARQCMENVRAILEEAGSDVSKVVKVNVFLDNRSDFQELNRVYSEFFGNDPALWPARTTVEARLPRAEFMLEIECVAEA